MKTGQHRFEFQLNLLEELLTKAGKQKNPALWLYQNNARTPLFMLEALADLYANLHNKKKFNKLKQHFKLLEDSIGTIDYYYSYAGEFASNKKIPAAISRFVQAEARNKIKLLNEILVAKKWLGAQPTRIGKIRKRIAKADWLTEKKDIEGIQRIYNRAINEILEFVNVRDFHFTHVEDDVHELRRKIRWLSIYPQALQGSIQLSSAKTAVPVYLRKYLTNEITGSKYNVMPDAGNLRNFLLLDRNRFYALSWMIAELGILKDEGLKMEILKEAILQTGKLTEIQATSKAKALLGRKQISVQMVLTRSASLVKTYCKEKNLESLTIGLAKLKT